MMNGAFDVNSPNGPILPWLRSIDAFNTHDEALQLAIAGGVTTVQVLPGSGNAIGICRVNLWKEHCSYLCAHFRRASIHDQAP